MNEKPQEQTNVDRLLADHQELLRMIHELRNWWGELDELGEPRFEEMAVRIRELRDRLSEHFAEEERGGYFTEPLKRAPHFSRMAEELREQHTRFLDTLDDLGNRLQENGKEALNWNEARDEFEAFVEELQQHETDENMIVQSAYQRDLGVGD